MGCLRNIQRKILHTVARQRILAGGLWFVDIPRTSSSAVRAWLFEVAGYPHGKYHGLSAAGKKQGFFPDHTTASEVRRFLGPSAWDRLVTFSLVRNPFDRFASLYLYYRHTEKTFDGSFAEFCGFFVGLKKCAEKIRTLRTIWMSQTEFLSDRRGALLVKHICKYENRHSDLTKIAKTQNLPLPNASVINPSPHKPPQGLRSLYDAKTAGIIRQEFADDFARFSYSENL